jgi:predicted metallopeptidase
MKFVDRELLIWSRRMARRIAKHFGINYRGVYHINKRRKDYKEVRGQTDESDACGRCYIELVFRNKLGRLYTIPQLVDTICHELAHIPTWGEKAHHSRNFWAWYRKIKGYACAKLL